jgi:uncharacterized protein YabE (DUF348 family)
LAEPALDEPAFEHWRVVRKKLLIGALGLALAATAGTGTAVYAAKDKTVTIVVDGQQRVVHTMAGTVGQVLAGQDIHTSGRDAVAPAVGSRVVDGGQIAVRHARRLSLDVDGKTTGYWVTASSVQDALTQLGLRFDGAKLSASRSAGIGRAGLALHVATLKHVVVRHDHRQQRLATTAGTVRGALAAAHVRLDGNDTLNAKMSAKLRDGAVLTVTRVSVKRSRVVTTLGYDVLHRADLTMLKGTHAIEQHGVKGKRVTVFRSVFHDGKRVSRTKVSSKLTRRPVDEVIRYGTKVPPPPKPKPAPAPRKAPVPQPPQNPQNPQPRKDPGGAGSLNWPALARCESGGNPRAVNPAGYYGLYQFSLSTWRSLGGADNPIDASAGEQTYRAQLLYQRSGAGQWPVCGHYLFS